LFVFCVGRYEQINKAGEAVGENLDEALRICLRSYQSSQAPKLLTPEETLLIEDNTREQMKLRVQCAAVNRNSRLTVKDVMESQTSLLQLCLNSLPFRVREGMGVPGPTEWSPIQCFFPFPVFKEIFKLNLQSSNSDIELSSSSVDVLKIRYVEFMSDVYKNDVFQLLHAVFSAMGSNVLNYPIRIFYILQEASLLRTELGLPTFRSFTQEVYKNLDQNFRFKASLKERERLKYLAKEKRILKRLATTASTNIVPPPSHHHAPFSLPRQPISSISRSPVTLNSSSHLYKMK